MGEVVPAGCLLVRRAIPFQRKEREGSKGRKGLKEMSSQKLPPGWDEDRVKRLIAHYDSMDDEALLLEDEAAQGGQTVMIVPTELVSSVRELITRKPSDEDAG